MENNSAKRKGQKEASVFGVLRLVFSFVLASFNYQLDTAYSHLRKGISTNELPRLAYELIYGGLYCLVLLEGPAHCGQYYSLGKGSWS